MHLVRCAVRRANPTANEQEIAVRFVSNCYGAALAGGLRRHPHIGRQ